MPLGKTICAQSQLMIILLEGHELTQLGALHVCPSTVILLISRRLLNTNATPSKTGMLSSVRSACHNHHNLPFQLVHYSCTPNSVAAVDRTEHGEKLIVSLIRTSWITLNRMCLHHMTESS